MEKEETSQELAKKLKISGITIIVCSIFSLFIAILLILLGTLLLAYPEPNTSELNIEAFIFLFGGLLSTLVSIVDLIAGIRILQKAKRMKGWAIYLICSGIFGGLLGYAMLGIGVYVLIQLNDKSNSVDQEVVTNT